MKNDTLKIFLTWYSKDEHLEVLVGPDSPALEGTVARVVRRNNISAGITKEGKGVYVRLQGAQDIDRTFKAVAKRIDNQDSPTKLQVMRIVRYCHRVLNEIAAEYAAARVVRGPAREFESMKERDLVVSYR